MAKYYSEYTSVHQDQQLDELVAPANRPDMYDLLDAIIEKVKEQYKQELVDDGWSESP